MGSLKKHTHYQGQKVKWMNKKIVMRRLKIFTRLSKEGKIENSLLILKEQEETVGIKQGYSRRF